MLLEQNIETEHGDRRAKFMARRDRAMATIVCLLIHLCYNNLIRSPEDPVEVWRSRGLTSWSSVQTVLTEAEGR